MGIAALMVFGFVVLITALTYDAPVKSDRPRDLALAHKRRRQRRERLGRQRQQASSVGRWAVRAAAVELHTLVTTLARKWWPSLRHHARRSRWLTLDSTTGQLIAGAAASVIAGCLIVAFG